MNSPKREQQSRHEPAGESTAALRGESGGGGSRAAVQVESICAAEPSAALRDESRSQNSTVGEFDADWLSARESADAAARSPEALKALPPLPPNPTVWDLAAGTGSLTRWLAPQLPGAQFVLIDHDPQLLDAAGQGVRRCAKLADLDPAEAVHADLIAASALLDVLTEAELTALAAFLTEAGIPAIFYLNVTGEVVFDPVDDLDAELIAAFNAHQRRGGRAGALAPELLAAAVPGAHTATYPSTWQLDQTSSALRPWLTGWLAAAADERPDLVPDIARWRERRLADPGLRVSVGHTDIAIVAKE